MQYIAMYCYIFMFRLAHYVTYKDSALSANNKPNAIMINPMCTFYQLRQNEVGNSVGVSWSKPVKVKSTICNSCLTTSETNWW